MNAHQLKTASAEKVVGVLNGWLMLAVTVGLLAGGIGGLFYLSRNDDFVGWSILVPILMFVLFVVFCFGFFTLQPNEARVLLLFGSYQGTVRHSGFHWTNPFNRKLPISLRARNFQSDKLKVNDKRGNPIEIASVAGGGYGASGVRRGSLCGLCAGAE